MHEALDAFEDQFFDTFIIRPFDQPVMTRHISFSKVLITYNNTLKNTNKNTNTNTNLNTNTNTKTNTDIIPSYIHQTLRSTSNDLPYFLFKSSNQTYMQLQITKQIQIHVQTQIQI